jgi:periplasmic protein TonB
LDTGADPEQTPRPGFRLGIRAIVAALILASCAIVAAPQAPWHPRMQKLWVRGQKGLHAWLNPQPVIPVQAPVAHENFARAGDEYKLPVTESIPDATTDPSQIRVLPVIDPTAKKPPVDNANPDQPAGTGDASATAPNDQTPPPVVQNPDSQPGQTPAQNPPAQTPPVTVVPSPASSSPAALAPAATPKVIPQSMVSYPAPHRIQPQPATAPGHIPSSLKSQMASSTPEASGNKPVEAALPSIEPVSVSESMERSLLAEQPPIAYPPSAKGQQGTVILQVLIGRDGTVQDAKFMQGSLAFARIAIEGVKQWKFKPYLMNGRPASVQTLLTMTFKPAA